MYDPKAGFNFKGDGSLKIGHEKGIEIEENHPSRGLEIRDADHLNLQDSCTLDIVGYWCAIEYSDFVINVGKDSTLNLSISEDATSFQRHGIRGNYSSEGQRNKLIVNGTFCAEVPIFAGSEPGTVFYCGIHGKPDVNDTRIEVGDGNVIYAGETAETAAIVDASVYADNSPQVSYMRICAE